MTPEALTLPETLTEMELVLEVSGGGRAGQEVRLRSARCSIGSGPHCTLRLKARDVAPLHCWVLRGPERTVVRCCSPDTRLNGRAFDEALLQAGDVLSCGPIELRVVELGGSHESRMASIEADADLAQRLSDLMQEREGFEASRRDAEHEIAARAAEAERRWDEIRQAQAELQATREALQQREQELARRSELLDRQVAAFEAECALQREPSADELKLQSDLERQTAELAAQWEQLREAERRQNERAERLQAQRGQEHDERDAQLQAREAEVAEREVNMRQAAADLTAAVERLDEERKEIERQRQERTLAAVEMHSPEAAGELLRRQEELTAGEAELARARADLAAWEARLQQHEDRLLERRAELQAEREQFYAECEAIARERESAALVELQPAARAEPPAAHESEPREAPAPQHVAHPHGEHHHGAHHDEEAAVIESYMSRLLGKSRTAAPAAPVEAAPAPAPNAVEEPALVAEEPVPAPTRERAERPTRAETLTDLSSMRELANANARHAIGHSRERQQFRAGVQRLCVAIVFTAFGVWLGYMSNVVGNWMYTLGCLAGGFGLVAALVQGGWLARRHLRKAWDDARRYLDPARKAVEAKLATIRKEATLRPEAAEELAAGEESPQETCEDTPLETVATDASDESLHAGCCAAEELPDEDACEAVCSEERANPAE